VVDGKEYLCKIVDSMGSEEHPLQWPFVVEKARALMDGSLDRKRTDKLISVIKDSGNL